ARLEPLGLPFRLHHQNFAGIANVLQEAGREGTDLILADLGFSSMQVDDPARGFSYRREGPLDMRLDRSRGRTAAQVLATIPQGELAHALRELADEPAAERLAAVLVRAREQTPIETTTQLARILQ